MTKYNFAHSAAEINTIHKSAHLTFANAAARDAWTTGATKLTVGTLCHLADTDVWYKWSGSAWVEHSMGGVEFEILSVLNNINITGNIYGVDSHIAMHGMLNGWVFNSQDGTDITPTVGTTDLGVRGGVSVASDSTLLYEAGSTEAGFFKLDPTAENSLTLVPASDSCCVVKGSESGNILQPREEWAVYVCFRVNSTVSSAMTIVGKAGDTYNLRTSVYIDSSGFIRTYNGGTNYTTTYNVNDHIGETLWLCWQNWYTTAWHDQMHINNEVVIADKTNGKGSATNNVPVLIGARYAVDTIVDELTDVVAEEADITLITAFFSEKPHWGALREYNESYGFMLSPYFLPTEIGIGSSTLEGSTGSTDLSLGWFQKRTVDKKGERWLVNMAISGTTFYTGSPEWYEKPYWITESRPSPHAINNMSTACKVGATIVYHQYPGNSMSIGYTTSPEGTDYPWLEYALAANASAREANRYKTTFIFMGSGTKNTYTAPDSADIRKSVAEFLYAHSTNMLGYYYELVDESDGTTKSEYTATDNTHYKELFHTLWADKVDSYVAMLR